MTLFLVKLILRECLITDVSMIEFMPFYNFTTGGT